MLRPKPMGVGTMSECKHDLWAPTYDGKYTCWNKHCNRIFDGEVLRQARSGEMLSTKTIEECTNKGINWGADWAIEEANACVFKLAVLCDKLQTQVESLGGILKEVGGRTEECLDGSIKNGTMGHPMHDDLLYILSAIDEGENDVED